MKPLKVVVNSGNSAAGPTFNAIATALGQNAPQIEFIRVHHQPDHTFSNGISNPLLPENHAATADVVMENDANLGVAFDGDFDRCFFLDEKGQFIDGEYIVGVLADVFLDKVPEASIIHDPCIIWNTQSVVAAMSGNAVQSKRVMRSSNKSCAKWMQFMVVKCRPTIIFAILPIVTAA